MNLRGFIKYALFRDTTHHGEFRLMSRLAGPDCPRSFVDVGANDGFYGSNSFPFVARGWRTILIEPHPGAFAKMQKRHAGRNNVTLINLACSETAGEFPLWLGADEGGTNASLCPEETQGSGQITEARQIRVRVERLDTLLAKHGMPQKFGILSIDAERLDYEVLLGLDLNVWRPRVIFTEDCPAKDARKSEYLKGHGYRCLAQCNNNTLWAPNGD